MSPLITIGICAKNAEPFIQRTINTILNQDFPHEYMEMIFVDDGSEDRTFSIIKESISNIDIKASVFRQEWKGVGAARNVVVTNAKGKYILWVDADQILSKDYVKTHVNFMEQNEKIAISYGFLDTTKGPNARDLDMISRTIQWKYSDKPKIGTGGATYRVKAIRQVGGFDSNLNRVAEDADASLRMQDAGWSIGQAGGRLYETHNNMASWRDLWNRYYKYGLSSFDIHKSKRDIFPLMRMSPFAGFLWGLINLKIAYKIFHRKVVFLLPIHASFKLSAWCMGFMKTQFSVNGM